MGYLSDILSPMIASHARYEFRGTKELVSNPNGGYFGSGSPGTWKLFYVFPRYQLKTNFCFPHLGVLKKVYVDRNSLFES